jgi:hypothetical protein
MKGLRSERMQPSSFPDAEVLAAQREVCDRYGVPHTPSRPDLKVGINLDGTLFPINGLREQQDPEYDELSGWFIWNGERSIDQDDDAFFKPLHGWHLPERCPTVLAYLALPPGWRFLIAPDHEDVWYDPTLLTPGD